MSQFVAISPNMSEGSLMRCLFVLLVLSQSVWALDFDEYHSKYWLKAKAKNGMFSLIEVDTDFGKAKLPRGYVDYYKRAMAKNAERFEGLAGKVEKELQEPMQQQLNKFIIDHTFLAITPLVAIEEQFAEKMSSRTFGTLQGRKFLMRDVNNERKFTAELEEITPEFTWEDASFYFSDVGDNQYFRSIEVIQIVDGSTFRGYVRKGDDVMFRGFPTAGMADDKTYNVKSYFKKTGTETYRTAIGGTRTVEVWEHQPDIRERILKAYVVFEDEVAKPVNLLDLISK